ncbi:histidinol-phosphate transaminase [Chryseolinea sp. T2]|uniref:pyridoxal phosphate-dependent aminotransferase n=1 Tax=Chryseolinea sp. T2 TaxID=3129255 RepID=UPI00307700D0
MNRRHWIRTSAMLAGGASLIPGVFNRATAGISASPSFSSTIREEVLLREFPNPKTRLFANENPFGPSEKAKKAIVEALGKSYQYPFTALFELQGKIATHEGVKPEQVMLGAGSSPLLHGTALYFAKQGGNIITGDPTYEDLPEKATALKTIDWVKVPLTSEHKLDLDEMEKRINDKTVMVYVCNPNNPTGTQVDTAKLKAFCERVSKKVLVFIDEAYIDYTADPKGMTLVDCVKKGQNVVVARTFSKLYGFAGLRVGYVIGQESFMKSIEPFTAGFACISATSGAAALAAYQETDFLADALKKTLASKEYLYSVLKKEGYSYIPSTTNFVMFPVNMDAERFTEEMMKRSVGVRPWKFAGKEWCRVSIGTMEEMESFAQAFKQIS